MLPDLAKNTGKTMNNRIIIQNANTYYYWHLLTFAYLCAWLQIYITDIHLLLFISIFNDYN